MPWNLIASAVLSLAAPPAQSREVGSVIIRFRFPGVACAGVCPNYQLTILANGEVIRGNPKREPAHRNHLYSNKVIRFRVDRSKLWQFRSKVDVFRPIGDRAIDRFCDQPLLLDGTASPDDVQVRWVDAGRTDRLTSCAGGPLRVELESALRTLGVNPYSGEPLPPWM